MANIGPFELIIVLVIALLVLGPKRLPDAGKSLGKGLREFKDALSGDDVTEREPRTRARVNEPSDPTGSDAREPD
jgi:sec-independent protein translocase protein TatA